VLDGSLGDQTVDRAPKRHTLFPEAGADLRRFNVGIQSPDKVIRELASQVFLEDLEVFFRAGALEDLQDRDGADPERDIPVENLAKPGGGGILAALDEVDEDRSVDEDHRSLACL